MCNWSSCSYALAGYLTDLYSNQGTYVQWGDQADANGYCVFYKNQANPLVGSGNYYDSGIAAVQPTGWIPPYNYASYQAGAANNYAGCGSFLDSWEHWWSTGEGCGTGGGWCGSVHWGLMPQGEYPFSTSGEMTLQEYVNPMNCSAQCAESPSLGLGSGGFFSTRMCALFQDPSVGLTALQNFELCYVPYYYGQYTGTGSPWTPEGIGSTPEQAAPCVLPGSLCYAQEPTMRLDATSSGSAWGTWESGSTAVNSTPTADWVQINISTAQFVNALNDTNLHIEQTYAQCANSNPPSYWDGQNCVPPYSLNASLYTLIGVEQDAEGVNVQWAGFSWTGLDAWS